ncbi:hypothetical protein BDV93DRAFT_524955 [Ceratobasidium sp. AG-I]|nr:hypothetical protein BDV93DRAFT_524955 [Ceratobasidium sp. AG-I]
MILSESAQSDIKAPSTVHSGDSEAPLSPPPYDPATAPTQPNSDQKPLPTPPISPASDFASGSIVPRADLPPCCNNLIERKKDGRITGIWHVDTSLLIPESLLAPIEDFDGLWNEAQRKARESQTGPQNKDQIRNNTLLSPRINGSIRPNLMLHSGDGSVNAKVHVVSSDGRTRPVVIVAESRDGSVTLEMRTYSEHSLRIFALSNDGPVRVKVPKSFEGAVIMTTKDGSTGFSDSVKSRLTTFSTASNTTRGFIGDWQSARFGTARTPSTSPLESSADASAFTVSDPFASWEGPLVHISSKDGSIQLSFSDDEPPAGVGKQGGFSSRFNGFMNELFGNT